MERPSKYTTLKNPGRLLQVPQQDRHGRRSRGAETPQGAKRINLGELLEYARICRVEKVMRPYLKAIL